MQIVADNILQSWCGYDSSWTLSFMLGALLLGLIILTLFVLHLYVSDLAANLWPQLTKKGSLQTSIKLSNFKELLSNYFILQFWSSNKLRKDPYFFFAASAFLLACTACLILPWSASHCNLPSKIALSGFSNQADLWFFFGFVLASYIPKIAVSLYENEKLPLKEILNYKLPQFFIFILAILGPVVLTGQMSLGQIVQSQEEGLFSYSWLGLYAIPSFLGAVVSLNSLGYWWPKSLEQTSRLKYQSRTLPPLSRLGFQLSETVNFFSLSSLWVLTFGGGWNLPYVTYPAYVNLGFLIAPYTDLLCGLLVFALKLILFAALWPGLYLCAKKKGWSKSSPSLCFILALINIFICALLAILYQAYLGG